jgi:peptidoglycan/LPS O-acetylase OafA/YrhL
MSHATDSQSSVPTASLSVVRVLLAVVVSVSHAHALSGLNSSWSWQFGKAAEIAVLAFFSISGFLVAQSFERSSNWRHYLLKRALRIYPAYIAAVLLFTVVLNLFYASSFSARSFTDQLYYLAANLAFLNFLKPSLPGIFAENLYPTINGALWTIKIEVLFYCLLPLLLGLGKLLGRRSIVLCCYAATCLLLPVLQAGAPESLDYHLFREILLPLSHFLAGVLFVVVFKVPKKVTLPRVLLLWTAAILLSALVTDQSAVHPLLKWLVALASPLVLGAANVFTAFLDIGNTAFKLPDLSYSLYLTHFPITQICCALGLQNHSLSLYWVFVLMTQWSFALLFWKFVERPALAFRDRRR